MIIKVRLSDFMDGTPVQGARVICGIVVEARWTTFDPERKELKIYARQREQLPVQPLGITQADGTFTWSVEAAAIFNQLRKLTRPDFEAPESQVTPDEVVALLTLRVSCAGLEQTLRYDKDPLEENATVQKNIRLDFAKTIVGETTPTSVRLWFCKHGSTRPGDRFFCEISKKLAGIQPPGTPIKPILVRTLPIVFDASQANTAHPFIDQLESGQDYTFRLLLREAGEPDTPGTGRTLARGEFSTPPVNAGRLSFVFSSCHEVDSESSLERWQALAERRDYDLMLLIGDQLYGDKIRPVGEDWFEGYVRRYQQYWAYRPAREVWRRTPTYMVLDDHDITGDWGTFEFPDTEENRKRFNGAIAAYRAFQQAHNPGGYDGSIHYDFRWGPASFFLMDSRTRRGLEIDPIDPTKSFPILGERQFKAMEAWASKIETKGADVIFFIAPVPLAVASIDEIRELEKRLLAGLGGLVGALALGPVGAALGYLGYQYPEIFERLLLGEELTTKIDVEDQWTSPRNQPDLIRVLDMLFRLANDTQADGLPGPHPRAVFVLGGDLHFAMMHAIVSKDRAKHGTNPSIFQIVSSPISHFPPEFLEDHFKDLRQAIPKTNLSEAILSVASSVNPAASPVQFALDTQGKRNYEALLLGLRATRNYSRIAVERVREDRRVYRFNLSIEGKAGSLQYTMEMDLDAPLVTPQGVAPYPAVTSVVEH